MKPSRFAYFDPGTVDEAVALLREYGDDAKVMAGGQSLMPMLSMRLAYPAMLIDLRRIEALGGIDQVDGALMLGAMVRQSEAEASPVVSECCRLLTRALPWVAHRSIRNRGTVGGSLAHGDAAAEIPAVMTALGATVTARSIDATREIPIDRLFEMPLVTTLAADELLTSIRVPVISGRHGCAVEEVARRHGDFAIAAVAVTVGLAESGVIEDARIVVFATGPLPRRSSAAEGLLNGELPTPDLVREAAAVIGATVGASDDIHASAEYRRNVTGVLVERAITSALRDAGVAHSTSGV